MSHAITTAVMRDCRLKGERRTLMLCLAHHADDEGVCWPSQPRLMEETNCTRRGVQKMLGKLAELGEIVVEEEGVGRGNSTKYRLAKYTEKGEQTVTVLGDKRRTDGSPITESEKANVGTLKGERGDTKGEPRDIKGEQAVRPNTIEHQLESQKNTISEVPVPSELDGEEFRVAWAEWLQYRRQRKPKLSAYTEIGVKKQFKALATLGKERAIAAIDFSIAQNYQGIFEPRQNGNGRPSKPNGQYPEDIKMPLL